MKVINLQRSLVTHIQDHIDEQPYLISIGEEVERVIEQLRQRQISAETALAELKKRAEQVAQAQEEQSQSSLDNLAFSLRMVLRANNLGTAQTAVKMRSLPTCRSTSKKMRAGASIRNCKQRFGWKSIAV